MDADSYFEQIEQYLSGQMPPEERTTFEQALENDPILAERVAIERALLKTLQEEDVRSFRTSLQKALESYQGKKTVPKGMSPVYKSVSIAASLLVLITVIWWWQTNSSDKGSEELGTAYLAELDPGIDSQNIALRSESEKDSTDLQFLQRYSLEWKKLDSLYTSGEYHKSLSQLQVVNALDTTFSIITRQEWDFYYAMCQMHLGENEKAIELFKGVQRPFLEKATFFQAIALLRLGRSADARLVLESIATAQSHFYKKAAERIIAEMD